MENLDLQTVRGFGDEWTRFDQSRLSPKDRDHFFTQYFSIFPWDSLPFDAVGFDLGCGSGRWARLVAPKVGLLFCIDASRDALQVARKNLSDIDNVRFAQASVDRMPLEDESMDFGYSLGVLHHVPDTQAGLTACVRKLRPGAPFLVYLYYRFENRPLWFRMVWLMSDLLRRMISKLPNRLRFGVSQLMAGLVYWPLARAARVLELCGLGVEWIPLSAYRKATFYTMQTDALDRFGTRLEQRFSRAEILTMLERAGLTDIVFREAPPYWCAVGRRSN